MTKIATTLKRGLFITAELVFIDCTLSAILTFRYTNSMDMTKRKAAVIVRNAGYLMAVQTVLVLPPAAALLDSGALAS